MNIKNEFKGFLFAITVSILIPTVIAVPVNASDLDDGMRAFRQKDYRVAIEKLNPLAIQGNAEAQLL